MNILQNILQWLGITSPRWLHESVARRNMPIVMVGALLVAAFSGLIAFFFLMGLPNPIGGFSKSVAKDPSSATRYLITSSVVTVVLLFIFLFALLYVRRKWNRPGIATAVTILFVFLMAMTWGIAEAGHTADRQVLIFASIQFLIAGLIILDPIVSILYFMGVFAVFASSLNLAGMLSDEITKDLMYLTILNVVVSWVVYGLYVRAAQRERAVVRQSQRDELTGAKNRHCLRDDFPTYLGENIFVLLCDIDDFKHFNDDYDHSIGDYMLRQFYFALREAFGDECVYRYGGDEFLIVSIEFGEAEFQRKVDKVAKQLSEVTLENQSVTITYSGGYAHDENVDNEHFRSLLHAADERLLEAKRSGKNQIIGS